jgi:hypothetical protein
MDDPYQKKSANIPLRATKNERPDDKAGITSGDFSQDILFATGEE